MRKRLTITIDEHVYDSLHALVGRKRISSFIENIVRALVACHDLEAGYKAMAQDEAHEAEALEWAEGMISDTAHE